MVAYRDKLSVSLCRFRAPLQQAGQDDQIFNFLDKQTAPLASNVYTFVGLLHGVTYFYR
jgi:hypothetical protein